MTTIIKNKYYLDIPNYPHEIAKFHRTISFHDLSSISITTNTHVPVNYIAFVNDRKFFPHRGSRPEMPCQNTHAIQFYWPLFWYHSVRKITFWQIITYNKSHPFLFLSLQM